ncbi:T9SS sorting signal type C domain-containing protein [Flavobacterium aestivum]|uniref:T9SS sorting signal type C domain-containing protein n=1 Tax=Flavobacterium aestivum TaxID=3003257 RepID=UPI002482775E|nr:T9SS sorting signal type C domain-containing protein [Flavobacterium aestivum]
MKKLFSLVILFPFLSLGQSIFLNPITGINPNALNPYRTGQIVDPNISVSGISRGKGILGKNAKNRYNATGWNTVGVDPTDYFEFAITPSPGKKIDFKSFVYKGQVSINGPIHFAFRSSVDGFRSNIGTVSAAGRTISLSSSVFQNITKAITFRIYGWAAKTGTGTFSINSFAFNGTVGCTILETPHLDDINVTCASTSFDVNWQAIPDITEYNLDVATDANFRDFVLGYDNRTLGNSTTQKVTGLVAGKTYYVRLRAKNECGYSDYSNTVEAFRSSTTYNSGLWSNGTPDSSKIAIFSSNYTIPTNMEACSCIVDSGVSVGVNSGVVLKLEDGLELKGTGVLIFENKASLIQVNNYAVNTGAIVYKCNTTPMKNFDYTYWSSPVAGQTLYALSPNTLSDKYFSYSSNKWIVESSANTMTPGKGYIIRVPKPQFWPDPTANTYAQSVEFIGIPNNGVYSFPIAPVGYSNLIGNPYPSAISADDFLLENCINTNRIQGTIHFWTHNTAISSNKYSEADYASYNCLGGVGTAAASTKDANANIPSGYIAAGQSFMAISAEGSGPVVFNNSMRINAQGKNTQFFKGVKSKTVAIEKHRVWLNLTNAEGVFKQILVGYATGATNGFDTAYDGLSSDGNKYVDFYSVNDNKNFVIQGRTLPFDKVDKVPLGYKTTIDGAFTISIDQIDGILVNQAIFIEDKTANVVHNLTNGAYTFSTTTGTFNDRFIICYKDNSGVVKSKNQVELVANGKAESSINSNKKEEKITVSAKNRQIKIASFAETIAKVLIYDLRGRQLYEKDSVNSNECIITSIDSTKQILVVVTILDNGMKQSNKIVF